MTPPTLDGSPASWQRSTLADVGAWSSGGTPKSSDAEYYGPGHPWAVIGDLDDGPVRTTDRSITPAGLQNSSAKLVPAGSLLVAMYGSIGKLGVAEIALATNQAIACLQPAEDVDVRWVFWWLRSCREQLISAGKGGTQQNISQTVLKAWPIPVPPLDEQQRIVAEIERLLVRESLLQGYASSIGSGIDRLRRKILHDLTRGPEKPLEELATTASGGTPKSSVAEYYGPGHPWAVIGDLDDGPVRTTDRSITPAGLQNSSAKLVPAGSLLVAMYGSIGKLGVAEVGLTTNQAIAAITPDPGVLRTRFLFYRLLADRQRLIRNGRGGAQRNISQSLLRAWPVPLLSLAEQDARTEQLDTHVSRLSATSAAVAAIPARGVHLRRSILKAAFEGRL